MWHFPTDDEIREAARQLLEGGFNGVNPEKAVFATRLIEGAGSSSNRGAVFRRITDAVIQLEKGGGS